MYCYSLIPAKFSKSLLIRFGLIQISFRAYSIFEWSKIGALLFVICDWIDLMWLDNQVEWKMQYIAGLSPMVKVSNSSNRKIKKYINNNRERIKCIFSD